MSFGPVTVPWRANVSTFFSGIECVIGESGITRT
jgi:hypothetical protein